MEAGSRRVEGDLHRQVVDDFGFFDHRLVDCAAQYVSAIVARGVERVCDILGRESLAVAPGDAIAQIVGQLGGVVVVLPTFGQPGILVAIQHVGEDKRLIEEADAILPGAAQGPGAPHLGRDERGQMRHNHGAVTRHFTLDGGASSDGASSTTASVSAAVSPSAGAAASPPPPAHAPSTSSSSTRSTEINSKSLHVRLSSIDGWLTVLCERKTSEVG
jgi:hypothetical protein